MKYALSTFLFFASVVLFSSMQLNTGLKVGDKAPDFELKNVNDELVSLSDFEDAKGFIVIFTCNSCPYSVLYEDRIIELHKSFSPKGYQVVAINPNDPKIRPADGFDKMKVRASEKGFGFPYLFDENQEVFPAYGATKTPHVFILDKDRTVKYIGAIDDNARDAADVDIHFVKKAISSIESGLNPDPSFTKAIGCSIKSKKNKKQLQGRLEGMKKAG